MDIEKELNNLHAQLHELYRGKSVDSVKINQMWTRVDKLESILRSENKREGGNN